MEGTKKQACVKQNLAHVKAILNLGKEAVHSVSKMKTITEKKMTGSRALDKAEDDCFRHDTDRTDGPR